MPNKKGKLSLSRKLLLPHPSDSGDSDDDMYGPAASKEISTREQPQHFGNVNQAFDGLSTAKGSSSQAVGDSGLVSDSMSDSTTVTQPADPASKSIRSRLRTLYDEWFSPAAAKPSSSQPDGDDKSNSKTTKQ